MPIIPSTEVETTDQKIKVILNCKGTLGLLKTQETLSQKLHEINKKNTSLLELPTSPQGQSGFKEGLLH